MKMRGTGDNLLNEATANYFVDALLPDPPPAPANARHARLEPMGPVSACP